jgi:hypothetical protein
MTDEVSFNLGSHSARIEAVEKRVIELQVSQKEQTSMLQQLLMSSERHRARVGLIATVGSVCGTLAALAVEYFKK